MEHSVYMDPEVVAAAKEAGIDFPDPNDPSFENRIIELTEQESPWARKLQGGVIYKRMGDPRELRRTEAAKKERQRTWRNRIIMKEDPEKEDHYIHRGKIFWIGVALLLPVIAALFLFPFLSLGSEPEVETASSVVSPVDIDAATPDKEPDIMTQVREFGVSLDETLSKDSDLVGVNLAGEIQDTDTSAAETPTDEEPGMAVSDTEGELEPMPATSAIIAKREGEATSGIIAQRLSSPTPNINASLSTPRESKPTVYAQAILTSSVVSSNERELAGGVLTPSESESVEAAEGEVLSATPQQPSTEIEPTPQPIAPATDSQLPFGSGDELDGALEVGVLTAEDSTVPTLVRTDVGVWQGNATLNAVGRIEIELSEVTIDGVTHPVEAKVFDEDGFLGVEAIVREETPALAADLITAGLRGVSDYVTDLADSATITSNNDQVVVENQVVPLEWALAGSLSELFSPGETKRAVVRVAEIGKGERVNVRVF